MKRSKQKYPIDSHRVVMVNDNLGSTELFVEQSRDIATREYCQFRSFEAGMDSAWLSIQDRSDHYNVFPPGTFEKEFGNNESDLAKRMLFLEIGGELIATASAWYPHGDWSSEYGRVHWVAVVPEFQGRGLSKVLLTQVLTAMSELGYTKSYLTTGSVRMPAIRLYEKFNFCTIKEKT